MACLNLVELPELELEQGTPLGAVVGQGLSLQRGGRQGCARPWTPRKRVAAVSACSLCGLVRSASPLRLTGESNMAAVIRMTSASGGAAGRSGQVTPSPPARAAPPMAAMRSSRATRDGGRTVRMAGAGYTSFDAACTKEGVVQRVVNPRLRAASRRRWRPPPPAPEAGAMWSVPSGAPRPAPARTRHAARSPAHPANQARNPVAVRALAPKACLQRRSSVVPSLEHWQFELVWTCASRPDASQWYLVQDPRGARRWRDHGMHSTPLLACTVCSQAVHVILAQGPC